MLGSNTKNHADADLIPRQHMEVPVVPTFDLFASAFNCSSVAQILIRADESFCILAASDGYLRVTGLEREDLIGHGVLSVFPDSPDNDSSRGQRNLRASLRRVMATRSSDQLVSQRYDIARPASEGGGFQVRFWNAHNCPILTADSNVAYILHSVSEVTERVTTDAFLVRLDDSIRPLTDADQIVATASRLLTEQLGVDRCTYRTYDPDTQNIDIISEYGLPGIPSLSGRYAIGHFGTEFARHMLANRPYVINDIELHTVGNEVREAYMNAGIHSVITIPLHKAGKLVAAMGVSHYKHARKWLPEEVALVSTVAYRCWESVERARVAQKLHASEQRLRLSHRAARIGSFEWLMKENRVIWTPELEALYDLPEGAFEGRLEHWAKRVMPEDASRVLEVIQQTTAHQGSECCYEFQAILPDGNVRWLRGQTQVFYDANGAPERMIGVNIDVTAQKKAQADLSESASRLRAIFDGTYEYIGLLTPQGIVLEANRASLEFADSSLSDVLGKPFWEGPWFTGTPGSPQTIRDGVSRAAAGEFVRLEATINRPSGESRTFDLSLHPVRDQQGEVVLIVPEGRDITERKRAEERLHKQWLTFDTALSNSPDLTYTFDLQGRFTYANRELCRVSQRSLQNTVGKTPAELGYPRELAERIQGQIRQVVETREGVRDQTAFRLPSGEVREYEYMYAPVIGELGTVEAITGATRDMTVRKQAEEQLRKSEMKFRQLFDSLPQLVWSSLPNGRDDLFNKQWFEYTGLSDEQVNGEGIRIIHPDDLALATERWTRSLKTGAPYEIEYRCRRFDGQYRWFLGRARPVRDEDGNVVRWFGTLTDIHEKKESETALLKAHRQLEEFSYIASHDLQEPLRMVGIYSHLILKQINTEDGKLAQYAEFVRQGVQRMQTLLEDLLAFSRASQSEVHASGGADLTEALQEAESVLASRIEENRAVIRSSQLPVVRGDTQQMAHIFQNLISNSLKYRKPDRCPEIHITATPLDSQWVISIRDNGIGFEQKYAERIFGLFKRLHRDEYPGTGLGLAICQRIVERYGGRMWADGRPGEGATFHFSLPDSASDTIQPTGKAHQT